LIGWLSIAGLGTAQEIQFNRQVLPVLAETCFECHGPDAAERKADLRLDQKSQTVDWDELLNRITSTNPDEVMPPPETGKELNSGQRITLQQWIAAGAEYEPHWAFRPIHPQSPPDLGEEKTSHLDRFIIAALRERGLKLSPKLSREKLIRRATFDLTGLPPTWSEVRAFVNDPSPDAFEKVIDRLLDSPEYGERWGRHWLDLARYADTHGGSAIGFTKFPFSYTYRDYVIDAFNADLPYDRFILD